MRVDELKDEVGRIRWFHSIDLGNGIVTPGVDRSSRRLKSIHMPESLAGMSVLDVGTFDGFYAFEAERRGGRVTATDTAVWRNPDIGRSGFDLARRVLGSNVQDREIDVLELSPETVGTFDLVLFLGVLYHLPDPMRALERIASVTRHQLIMETHVDLLGSRRPAAAFYPRDELQGDGSNWWGPNLAAGKGMLEAVGLARVEVVFVSSWPFRLARAAKHRYHGKSALSAVRQGRAVFHAFKD
ncbi:MAG: class I SAM-dependent methyltransferase [Acidimicrobiales bacterium]